MTLEFTPLSTERLIHLNRRPVPSCILPDE